MVVYLARSVYNSSCPSSLPPRSFVCLSPHNLSATGFPIRTGFELFAFLGSWQRTCVENIWGNFVGRVRARRGKRRRTTRIASSAISRSNDKFRMIRGDAFYLIIPARWPARFLSDWIFRTVSNSGTILAPRICGISAIVSTSFLSARSSTEVREIQLFLPIPLFGSSIFEQVQLQHCTTPCLKYTLFSFISFEYFIDETNNNREREREKDAESIILINELALEENVCLSAEDYVSKQFVYLRDRDCCRQLKIIVEEKDIESRSE